MFPLTDHDVRLTMIGDFAATSPKRAVVMTLLAITVSVPLASAQSYVEPFVGVFDGGRADCTGEPAAKWFCGPQSVGVGLAGGRLWPAGLGVEVEGAYLPDFFGTPGVLPRSSHAWSVSSDFLLASKLGRPPRSRLFVEAGGGLLYTHVSIPRYVDASSTTVAINAGAGIIVHVNRVIAIRSELRWFEAFDDVVRDLQIADQGVSVGYFYRLDVGVLVLLGR